MFMRTLKSFAAAEKGVAAIETAIILPVLLLMYFGMIDLTQLISLNRKITYAASIAADATSQNRNTVLKSAFTDYYKGVKLIMDPVPETAVEIKLYGYRTVAGAVTQIWKSQRGTAGVTCNATPDTSAMAPLMTAGNDVIVAITCMDYTPFMATFLGEDLLGATSFNLSQTVMLRPRSSLQLTCYQTVVGGAVCS